MFQGENLSGPVRMTWSVTMNIKCLNQGLMFLLIWVIFECLFLSTKVKTLF